jgi:endonuclease/exonuclease/phosphatase family metal-dependent hydrolase
MFFLPGCTEYQFKDNDDSDEQYNTTDISIASFNIKIFGKTKASNDTVMALLVDIVSKYDIIAIQEIKDIDQEVPYEFLELLNNNSITQFEMLLSERSGSQEDDKSSQEQYAILYNPELISVKDNGTLYNDSVNDSFQREPFLAHLTVKNTTLDFVLGVVHTKPAAAEEEISSLIDVFDWSSEYYEDDDVMIVGDYNADCSYFDEDEIINLEIGTEEFLWAIPNDADTNLANSNCTYDRMVLSGDLKNNFNGIWGVDNTFSDNSISDHWPVWIELSIRID